MLYLGTGVFLYVAVGALTPELKEAEEISVEKGLSRQVNIERRFAVLIVNQLNEIISDGFWASKSWYICWFHDCGMLFKIRRPDVSGRWMWRSIRLFWYK